MPGVDTKFVKYEVKDRVAWVTLNRPEAMNALSQGLLADLGTVFREIGRDDDVLVVILTGEGGRAFSAGADLKEMAARMESADGDDDYVAPGQAITARPAVARGAVECFERFGRGRHPARLNFSDCLSYASAKALGARLLFKGDDFAKSDAKSWV